MVLDITLITQTKKQLNTVFHDLGDAIIVALSPTERISAKVLEYRYFSHVNQIGKSDQAYKNDKIRPKKEIFALYSSGAVNVGDGSFRQKLRLYILMAVLAVAFSLYQLYSLMGNNKKEVTAVSSNNLDNFSPGFSASDNNNSIINKAKYYFLIYCTDGYCFLLTII